MRRELKCVQAEYEDIVRELEGGVEHLSWRGQFIPKPHFTDAVKFITHHSECHLMIKKGRGLFCRVSCTA